MARIPDQDDVDQAVARHNAAAAKVTAVEHDGPDQADVDRAVAKHNAAELRRLEAEHELELERQAAHEAARAEHERRAELEALEREAARLEARRAALVDVDGQGEDLVTPAAVDARLEGAPAPREALAKPPARKRGRG